MGSQSQISRFRGFVVERVAAECSRTFTVAATRPLVGCISTRGSIHCVYASNCTQVLNFHIRVHAPRLVDSPQPAHRCPGYQNKVGGPESQATLDRGTQ